MTEQIGEQVGQEESTQNRPGRKPRTPVGQATDITAAAPGKRQRRKYAEASRNVLGFTGEREPGFTYRVVNDEGTRLAEMLDRGYEIVQDAGDIGDKGAADASKIDSRVQRVVNPSKGTVGVLMRIRDEFYREDQQAKQAEVDKSEKGLLPKDLTSHYAGQDDTGQQIGIRIGN